MDFLVLRVLLECGRRDAWDNNQVYQDIRASLVHKLGRSRCI
jgi:hypothetical protein